jgi:cephalosporin hydroxylase
MKISIDTDAKTLVCSQAGAEKTIDLYSKEAFEIITQQWLKVGWDRKYSYGFSWMGRPIVQLPEDMVRIQEVIYRLRPDVIIETGVAHGGSLIFYASLCQAMGHGRIVGIDIEIRPPNRQAIESHELSSLITLLEGSSTDPVIVAKVKKLVEPHEAVLVILDSCHTQEHVRDELMAYHDLVSIDSYIVATDGIMKDVYDTPRGDMAWQSNHPTAAAAEFAQNHPNFVLEQPHWPFNESELTENITHWPGAWLRRQR